MLVEVKKGNCNHLLGYVNCNCFECAKKVKKVNQLKSVVQLCDSCNKEQLILYKISNLKLCELCRNGFIIARKQNRNRKLTPIELINKLKYGTTQFKEITKQ